MRLESGVPAAGDHTIEAFRRFVARPKDEILGGEIRVAELTFRSEGMREGECDAEAGVDEPFKGEAWPLTPIANDRDVDTSGDEIRELVLVERLVECEMDCAMVATVMLHGFKNENSCAGKEADGKVAELAEACCPALFENPGELFERLGSGLLEDLARSGEPNASAHPDEEVYSERFLETVDASAERGLGDVEPLCSSPEMELFSGNQEVAE
jgi:hypothetical protein